ALSINLLSRGFYSDPKLRRCHSPEMVQKEILMHLIAYNAVRLLMLNSAKTINQLPRKMSFKGSVQALRQWEPQLNLTGSNDLERRRMMSVLIEAIAAATVYSRPGRREPRCVKRR